MNENEIVRTINKKLESAGLSGLKIEEKDVVINGKHINIEEESLLSLSLREKATNRKYCNMPFFHFKKPKYALDILEREIIQVNNLDAQNKLDQYEYEEYFHRLGVHREEHKELKSKYHILCFTKELHNDKMWKEFGDDERNVCFEFKIETIKKEFNWDFRDVYYDSGYDLDFYRELLLEFKQTGDYALNIAGSNRMAQFYKRAKFRWENESRISIDQAFIASFPVKTDKERTYIDLELKNSLFNIQIKKIFYGRNIGKLEFEKIESVAKIKNIEMVKIFTL